MQAAERDRARQAVLRLLRARRHARAAPSDARNGSTSSRASSTWAGTRMREQIFANQKRLGVIPQNTQLTPWPDDLPKWDTLDADEKKLFARQAEVFAAYVAYTDHEIGRVIQAVEDLGKLDNTLIIYISGDNGTSAEGTTDRHAERVGRAFKAIRRAGRRPAEVLRRLGLRPDLPAHVGGVVLGVRHAVQVDQAGRLALRRHAPGHGDVVAGAHQGRGRHPHPVPPHDRHRADDPRSDRHPGAGDGRRRRAEADRGREHGLHVGQGQRRRALDAHDAVFRDVRQSRASTTTAGYACDDAAGAALAAWARPRCPDVRQRLQVGALQPRRGLFAGQRPRGTRCRTSCARCRSCSWSEAAKYQVFPLDNSILQRAADAAAERHRRAQRVHLLGRDVRHARRRCAEHPRPGPTPSLPRSKSRKAAATACSSPTGGRFGGYGFYLLKGKPVFIYNLLDLERFRWEGRTRSRPASTRSCSTSPTTAPASARAAPAC